MMPTSVEQAIKAVLVGGTAPLISTFLLERFAHSWLPVAGYLVLVSSVSLCRIAVTRETWNADLQTAVPSGEPCSPASLKALGAP